MKKYITIMLLIGILLGGVLTYNIIKVNNKSTKKFAEAGYILQSTAMKSQNVERYYFSSESEYKNKYNEKLIFKDTEGENVKVDFENFIHYSNGSISSFTNGVLLNLEEIEENPICYYNIKASSILQKVGEVYSITNLDQQLKFENVLWKIGQQKYIILSKNINLVFDDGTNKVINGYVEIEYLDNEVVKIYNQEFTCQTISSKVYIELPNEMKINLSTKIVSKNNDNKMSLENMVIDSDDNVTIVDLNQTEDEKEIEDEEEKEEKEKKENQVINNTQNQNNTTQNTSTIINSGGMLPSDSDDEESETIKNIQQPNFKVEKLNINSIGIDSEISISDENNLLSDDTKIKIIKNSTGKVVYEVVEALGNYNINLAIETLEPDTEYTIMAESSYKLDEMTYTKNFLSKIFRTTPIGIDFEKDLFTDTSLRVAVLVNKNTEVKNLDLVLLDKDGNKIQTRTVACNSANMTEDEKILVEFVNLDSNTTYHVSVANVQYNSQVLANGVELIKKYTTLKERPIISEPRFEINKRDGNFKLKLNNVWDKDKAIYNYRFEVYDVRMENSTQDGFLNFQGVDPVYVINSQGTEAILPIDDIKIFRNIGYIFKVVAEGNDNEKLCEYESEFSEILCMDGEEFPTVRFEASTITFERIEGKIIVEDKGQTIHLTDDTVFTVTYADSTGRIRSFTSQGSYVIPVSVNNLRSNETYQFSVYTTVDLNDGNAPIEECYIGGVLVKTDTPKNMKASFTNLSSDVTSVFNLNFKLNAENEDQGTLEPQTLTGMVFSIYVGQTLEGEMPSGNPVRTVKVVDTDVLPYESELKSLYYDNSVNITPEFFNARNKDFKEPWYTVVVSDAYDYTDYKNPLPIVHNMYSIQTNGYMPDLPSNIHDAVIVTAIRNRNTENPREDLEPATIVGYDVKAVYDNSELYATKIIYKAYDSNTNKLIKTVEKIIGSDGVIPTERFLVEDGTSSEIVDIDALRRGNSYYFTYEMLLDLNKDGVGETKYPYEEDGEEVILRSSNQKLEKQQPQIIMYPSTSTANTITFKYKCSDVDNAILNNNMLQAKIGSIVISQAKISNNTTEFETVTFEKLSKGDLTVSVLQKLLKTDSIEERKLIQQKFEGINAVDKIEYEVYVDVNKVGIRIIDSASQIDNIAALKVVFTATDGSATIVKDLIKIPDNNIVGINLNELGSLLKKETAVEVFAYYNSGVTGYDLDADHYVTFKKAKIQNAIQDYYTINSNNKFVEDPSIRNNMYNAIRNEGLLQIQNPITYKVGNIDLAYSENGFKYQGNAILQQRIDTGKLKCSGTNIINFDIIIPGISLKNEKDEWDIQTELDNISLKADVIIEPKIIVKDEEIFIEIYETDENGISSNLIKTERKKIADFDNKVTISGLSPRTYYYMKFRTCLILEDGSLLEKYFYDVDYQVDGKLYYFSTLADVEITNINVKYSPTSYNEKYINLTYNLGKITGYSWIEYNIYHYNEEKKIFELFKEIEPNQILKSKMDENFEINPGSGFIFGDKYKIEIIPIAEYQTLDSPSIKQKLELGKKEQEFVFRELQNPIIAIRGTRVEGNKINYRITIYDTDKVIKNGEYSVQIFEGQDKDITPEECKNGYNISKTNNFIEIPNVYASELYTMNVQVNIDLDNSGDNYTQYIKKQVVPKVNSYGISVGDVTPGPANDKIELMFNNSYNLTQIKEIKYSIYDTSGYAQNGNEQFIPVKYTMNNSGDTYYTYVLPTKLPAYGKYIVELQFIKDNETIEEISVEYIYRNG